MTDYETETVVYFNNTDVKTCIKNVETFIDNDNNKLRVKRDGNPEKSWYLSKIDRVETKIKESII